MGSSHLIARQDHLLCAVCGEVEPVHAGNGTPLPSLLLAYAMAIERHPAKPHKKRVK